MYLLPMEANKELIKPFLRWAGSKRKSLPYMMKYWTGAHNRYFEPFMGSAALFFAIQPKTAILSDTNKKLVDTFNAVRNRHKNVLQHLQDIPCNKETFYSVRSQSISRLTKTKRAANFIFLNRFCFNGLYRTNLKGKFNVPYCPAKTGSLPSGEHLLKCSKALKSATIHAIDFEQIISFKLRKTDFIYLDPPYAINNRRIFTQYGPNVFGSNDIKRLKTLLYKIDKCGATFLLSYAWSSDIQDIFSNWNIEYTKVQRNIAGFASHRKMDKEVLISNK